MRDTYTSEVDVNARTSKAYCFTQVGPSKTQDFRDGLPIRYPQSPFLGQRSLENTQSAELPPKSLGLAFYLIPDSIATMNTLL